MSLQPDSDAENAFAYPTTMNQIQIALKYDIEVDKHIENFVETKTLLASNGWESTREGYLEGAETFRKISEHLDTMLAHLKASYKAERQTELKHMNKMQLAHVAERRELEKEAQKQAAASGSTSQATALNLPSKPIRHSTVPTSEPGESPAMIYLAKKRKSDEARGPVVNSAIKLYVISL